MVSNPSLWNRIARYPLDAAGAGRPYSAKLADTEGWSAADTDRVVAEYRRFLYLASVLDAPAMPPRPLDAAWRAHLLHTRAYWEDFTPEVLRRPLHRDASLAAEPEARKEFYRTVLAAYRGEFGEEPPRDIWVHPSRPDWAGFTAIFAIAGFLGAFLSFAATFLIGWLQGIDVVGPAESALERVGASVFMLCLGLAVGSPLWASIAIRLQNRLRTTKRARSRTTFGIGISIGRDPG